MKNLMILSKSGRWLILPVAVLMLVFMLACISMFIVGIFEFSHYAAGHVDEFIPYTPLWTPQDFNLILSQFGLSFESWLQYSLVTSILVALVFWGVGFLIFFRNRHDWFGLYIGTLFVLFGTFLGAPLTAFSGLHPEFTWILTPSGVLAWWGLFMLLFLFPNGRFVPSWTRWIALLLLLVYSVIFLMFGGSSPPPPLILVVLCLFGIGAASQVYRYRRVSTAFERQQTKWVMFTLVIAFVILIFSFMPSLFPDTLRPGSPANLLPLVLSSLPNFFLALIPISVAIAILRYRLWDIDLVIRRTLEYGLLTFFLGMVYFGLVTLLQALFVGFSQQQSPLTVVVSTLAIAALFTPLRRRIQIVIDRRFFRTKYDADRAVASFSAAARSQVELETLAGQLATVAQDSLQPEGVWVWIRKDVKRDA